MDLTASGGALVKILRNQRTERAPMLISLCSEMCELLAVPVSVEKEDDVGFVLFDEVVCLLLNISGPVFFPRNVGSLLTTLA